MQNNNLENRGNRLNWNYSYLLQCSSFQYLWSQWYLLPWDTFIWWNFDKRSEYSPWEEDRIGWILASQKYLFEGLVESWKIVLYPLASFWCLPSRKSRVILQICSFRRSLSGINNTSQIKGWTKEQSLLINFSFNSY